MIGQPLKLIGIFAGKVDEEDRFAMISAGEGRDRKVSRNSKNVTHRVAPNDLEYGMGSH